MNASTVKLGRQEGYLLLEALISLVIFSLGVLGLMALLATAIQNNSQVKYRIDASLLASELIGRMWSDDRSPTVLLADYQGSGGSGGTDYTAWLTDIVNNQKLPGVTMDSNAPTVAIQTVDGPSPPTTSKSRVTITLFWQMPEGPEIHNYVVTTTIR